MLDSYLLHFNLYFSLPIVLLPYRWSLPSTIETVAASLKESKKIQYVSYLKKIRYNQVISVNRVLIRVTNKSTFSLILNNVMLTVLKNNNNIQKVHENTTSHKQSMSEECKSCTGKFLSYVLNLIRFMLVVCMYFYARLITLPPFNEKQQPLVLTSSLCTLQSISNILL